MSVHVCKFYVLGTRCSKKSSYKLNICVILFSVRNMATPHPIKMKTF